MLSEGLSLLLMLLLLLQQQLLLLLLRLLLIVLQLQLLMYICCQGRGDTSGGCQCRVKGRLCHPKCGNCH